MKKAKTFFDIRDEDGKSKFVDYILKNIDIPIPRENGNMTASRATRIRKHLDESGFEYASLLDPENAFRFWFNLLNIRNGSVMRCHLCGNNEARIYAVRMHIGGYCLRFGYCENCGAWLVTWPNEHRSVKYANSTYLEWGEHFIKKNTPIFSTPPYIDLFSVPKGDDSHAKRLREKVEEAGRKA